MKFIRNSGNWKKKFFNFIYILLFTVVLLELTSLFVFKPLTKKEFTYKTVESERLMEIARLEEQLDITHQFKTKAIFDFHPYVGYVGRKDAQPWADSQKSFNEYGMLTIDERKYPYEKKPNEFVVAVLGGSVAEIFANVGERHLNRYLKASYGVDKKVVFINLATGGYKQPQQLFHLQYALLSGFVFDAVINIDGFNDLVLASNNLDQAVHPVFPSAFHIGLMSKMQMNNGLDRQSVKFLSLYYEMYENLLTLLSYIQKRPFKYSVFLNLSGELLTQQFGAKIANLKYSWTTEAAKTISDEYRGPQYFNAKENFDAVTDIWQHASEMLFAICKANNMHYLHILQPNQYVEGSKLLSKKEREIAISPDNEWGIKARQGYSFLVAKGEMLKEKGVPFYDFSMIFKRNKRTLYVDNCCHFNEEGNRLMARHLASIVKDLVP